MIDKISTKFESKAIKYGRLRLYFYKDAVDVITECQKHQIKILGFDSFKLSAQGIQPFMEFSHDYSLLEKHLTWDKAKEDICKYAKTGLVFEMVYE